MITKTVHINDILFRPGAAELYKYIYIYHIIYNNNIIMYYFIATMCKVQCVIVSVTTYEQINVGIRKFQHHCELRFYTNNGCVRA